jgi:hypothetical protein
MVSDWRTLLRRDFQALQGSWIWVESGDPLEEGTHPLVRQFQQDIAQGYEAEAAAHARESVLFIGKLLNSNILWKHLEDRPIDWGDLAMIFGFRNYKNLAAAEQYCRGLQEGECKWVVRSFDRYLNKQPRNAESINYNVAIDMEVHRDVCFALLQRHADKWSSSPEGKVVAYSDRIFCCWPTEPSDPYDSTRQLPEMQEQLQLLQQLPAIWDEKQSKYVPVPVKQRLGMIVEWSSMINDPKMPLLYRKLAEIHPELATTGFVQTFNPELYVLYKTKVDKKTPEGAGPYVQSTVRVVLQATSLKPVVPPKTMNLVDRNRPHSMDVPLDVVKMIRPFMAGKPRLLRGSQEREI